MPAGGLGHLLQLLLVGNVLSLFREFCGVGGLQVLVPCVVIIGPQGVGGLVLPTNLAEALQIEDLVAGYVAGAVGDFYDGGVPQPGGHWQRASR